MKKPFTPHYVTAEDIEKFYAFLPVSDITEYRKIFFSLFRLSHCVKSENVEDMIDIISGFYDETNIGYNGIMEEIKDRVYLYSDIDGYVPVKEFLVHKAGKSDIFDKENRVSYEKKTGCGDWLRSEKSCCFDDVVSEYIRKRTVLRWDYDYTARAEGMTGTKSVDKSLPEEKQKVLQERTKKKVSKEYSINIHIETSYKKFFEYLATYPKGINTFFKESSRSGIAGVYVWEMQTIKNSRKKIEFLQYFNTWEKTGKSFAEWKAEQKEKEEE